MSADNLIRITKKEDGTYRVTHESASSLVYALNNIEPTQEELLSGVIADNIANHEEALRIAHAEEKAIENDGGEVEYGIVDENWHK